MTWTRTRDPRINSALLLPTELSWNRVRTGREIGENAGGTTKRRLRAALFEHLIYYFRNFLRMLLQKVKIASNFSDCPSELPLVLVGVLELALFDEHTYGCCIL